MIWMPPWSPTAQPWPFPVPCPAWLGLRCAGGDFMHPCAARSRMKKIYSASHRGDGQIVIKLFNLVLKDLAPGFLQQGIRTSAKDLQDLLNRHLNELKTGCISAELDGEPVEINSLLEPDWDDKTVFLKVRSEKAV